MANELLIRFFGVLSLDRFGDYMQEHISTPVREIAAQNIAIMGEHAGPELFKIIVEKLG